MTGPVKVFVDRSSGHPRTRAAARAEPAEPGPRWREDPVAGVRMLPPVDDDAVVDAVLMARAVVRLDEQRWKQAVRLADREQRIGELETQVGSLTTAVTAVGRRIAAVRFLHREAVRSTPLCSEPCMCSHDEPLGVCDHCGQRYPCATIRAVEGEGR